MSTGKSLAGLRVLDLARVLAGPYCTQILADLGAEVIKIERPGKGDDARVMGPPYFKDRNGVDTDLTPMFAAANRNKQSVTVNLAHPDGQDIVRRLADQADVLVENYKVGDLARHGLDQASLRQRNPRLIYCSITGFGQTGPYAQRPGYDSVFQATSGLMSVTGFADANGGAPVRMGVSITDIVGGLHGVIAIQAALRHRDLTGAGQYIDLGLLDVAVATTSHLMMTYLATGNPPTRRGNEGVGGIPSDMWPCADGYLLAVAGNDAQYRRLCSAMGRMDLADDPRFRTNSDRQRHKPEVYAVWRAEFSKWTTADAERALLAAGLPVAPVNDLAQVTANEQVRARGMLREIARPSADPIPTLAFPARFTDIPDDPGAPPPRLGEHNQQVLGGLLGFDPEHIARLARERAI